MAKPVNIYCPISGEEADANITRNWQSQTVAFCSSDCAMEWDDLTDDEKQERLDDAMVGQ